MFWWTVKCASPWRNFGNGPWSRVGGSGECVSDRVRGAGRGLQLLADSLVILRTTNQFTPHHAMIRNNHCLLHKISQSGGTLLPELGHSPPPYRGKRVTACLGDCRLPCSCPPSRTWAAPAGTRQSSPCLTSPKTARSLEGGKNLWVTLPHTAYSQNNSVLGKRVERMIVMHKRWFVRWKTYFSTIDPSCVVAHLQQGGFGWCQTVCIRPSCLSDAEVSF